VHFEARQQVTGELRPKRLYWLVAAHVVLAAVPLLGIMVPFSMESLPLMSALIGVPIGSLTTLSVWLGMGSARIWLRLLGAAVATAYVTLMLSIVNILQIVQYTGTIDGIDNLKNYSGIGLAYLVVVLLFGGMFALLGRRYELRLFEPHEVLPDRERFQFSVLHVLVIMSAIAVVLTLLRASRSDTGSATSDAFEWTSGDSLAFIVFFLNTLCAAYTALWPSGVKRNLGLVMVVSGLLGLVLAFSMGDGETTWLFFVGAMFIAIVPTMVETASLLVVRSSGYRLIRRANEARVARV
jgi:hypothetical protein